MPLTNLPRSARTVAYSTVVATLKADATLAAVLPAIRWATFSGEATQPGPAAEADGLPNITVIPFGPEASPETSRQQNSPLGIHVVVTTDGLDVRDLLDLWAAVEAAIFLGDGSQTLIAAIRAAFAAASIPGTFQPLTARLRTPAVAVHEDPHRNGFCQAAGTLEIGMVVPK